MAPKTPTEYWDAIDYLVRTGQGRLAVPYLNGFLKSNPDDATLVRIRDQYGLGSVLRLQDDPATRAAAEPLLKRFAVAIRRVAADPRRIDRAIDLLTKSTEEQGVGVDLLRQAGPYAVPALIRRLQKEGVTDEDRALIVSNMGRLDSSAVPALIAALDAPDAPVAAAAADALGHVGDSRAIPYLTYLAAKTEDRGSLEDAARQAIERLSGRPFGGQPLAPVRVLTDQARRYHRHEIQFPADTVEIWRWQGDAPAPSAVTRSEAEATLGLRLAREALELDPSDAQAQVVLLSLALEKAAERHGAAAVARQDPDGAFAKALEAGPALLGAVVRSAIAEGHSELASVAALALARVSDRDALGVDGRLNPLVEALTAPDRRVQLAAAAALVGLEPRKPFPGSSRVVPVLARFVASQSAPRAVVIDGSPNRAGGYASALRGLGYDPKVAGTGREGFELAAESADVELVLIDPTALALTGSWNWQDLVVNLRADPRTSGLPIFLAGPMSVGDKLGAALAQYPRTAFVVATEDPRALKPQLDGALAGMGYRPLTAEERQGYAQAAASLLARIATQPGSPFEADLAAVEPTLSAALNNPAAGLAASTALGEVPKPDAQRSLADALLDPSKPGPLRINAGNQLVRSVQRFGPLLTNDQEKRLLEASNAEADPTLRSTLAAVLGALRPEPEAVGARLRTFAPPRAEAPAGGGQGIGVTPAAAQPVGETPAPEDSNPPTPEDSTPPAPEPER